MDLSVFIADIPFAPPFIAATAGIYTFVIFGVIFAINGIFVVSVTALL